MRKFLSIVIPKYKETEKEIFPLLASISTQVGVNFSDIEVIIANDGGGIALDKNFLYMFGMDIAQIELEKNGGPGVARQAGLNAAQGEYIMFCDADDSLHNVGVLGALLQEAKQNAPDMLSTSWLEELVDETGKYCYITHENDATWMHGKLFRRNFLMQNDIRFHDKLRVHEDSYFLCIAASLAKRNRYLPITSYVWKHRPDSITRRDGGIYTFASIPEFIRACSLAHAEVENRVPEQMEYKILQFTLYNYFSFHRPEWQNPEHSEHRKKAEESFAKNIAPMWHYWLKAESQTIANIYNEERKKNFNGCMETETIGAWLKRLGLKQQNI